MNNNIIFTLDHTVEKAVKSYANQAVSYAFENFGLRLDWSDSSIENVELILDKIHKQTLKDKPSFEDMFLLAKAFGSYIGEVYRCNHQAQWGLFTWDNQIFPGLRTQQKGFDFWPWAKAQKRIEEGEVENIFLYYQMLLKSSL